MSGLVWFLAGMAVITYAVGLFVGDKDNARNLLLSACVLLLLAILLKGV